MRIHDLVIDNVRAIEHLELHDLPDTGVILIHGENEAGKSTILDALDAVLFHRHSAGGKEIRSLEPAGRDVGPEVRLGATVGPYRFTIHKRFRRSKKSELTIVTPEPAQYTGREADDKLAEILDNHLDRNLASTLFLRQGADFSAIAAAGIPSITRALDAGGEESLAGTEDTELMERIAEEYGKFYTAQGKKKADFAALEKAVEAARTLWEDKNAELTRLGGAVDEVERRTTEIADIDAELPEAEQEHARRTEEAEAARGVKAQADAAREKRARAAVDLERAAGDVATRRATVKRVEELRGRVDAVAALLAPAEVKAEEESATLGTLGDARNAAREAVVQARAALKSAREDRERAAVAERAESLREVVRALDESEAEVDRFLAAQPERPVTADDVRRIEKADGEVSVQREVLRATSARLDVTAEAPDHITVDGEDVQVGAEETAVSLADGTVLDIGDVRAVYHAGATADDAGTALAAAERELAEALEAAGCEDLDDARAKRDEHTRLAAALEKARTQRSELTAGRDGHELRAELARLEQVEQPASGEMLSRKEADERVSAAERAFDEATEKQDQAEAALKPWAEKKAAAELAVLKAQHEVQTAQLAAAEEELRTAEEEHPGEVLDAAHTEAAKALRAAEEEEAELARNEASVNPELAEELLAGAVARLDNLRERRAQADRRIIELSSHIDVATGAAEQADRAAAQLEAAEVALRRGTRRAEAVKLLWDTMRAHRDTARARYAEPFAQALGRHATVVFGPDVTFTLGDDLQVEARTIGATTIPLAQLSGGAKEQLGILTRFAIAELAAKGGDGDVPMPVVIDDALGATDPDRLALMNSLFSSAGRDAQVIVLTCFPKRFDRVVAARRASISELTR